MQQFEDLWSKGVLNVRSDDYLVEQLHVVLTAASPDETYAIDLIVKERSTGMRAKLRFSNAVFGGGSLWDSDTSFVVTSRRICGEEGARDLVIHERACDGSFATLEASAVKVEYL